MADFLFAPTPNEDAIAFIANKPLVSREVFNKLLPELKALAFTISGVQGADTLQRVRDRIADLPAGGDWDDIKKQILPEITPYFVDPDADEEERAAQERAASTRAELLIRTHGQQAYATAQYGMLNEQRDLFPNWQYLTLGDGHVRPTHAALDGIVLPANHEFWNSHYPPWEWGCRCQVVPLTRGETAKMQTRDEDKPADQQRVLGDFAQADLTATRRLVRNGVTYNLTAPREEGKPGAFTFHPGDLRITAEMLKQRYDPDIFAAFEQWAKKQSLPHFSSTTGGRATIWDWVNGTAVNEQAKVPVPRPKPTPAIAKAPTKPPAVSAPPKPPGAPASADDLIVHLQPHITAYLSQIAPIDLEIDNLKAQRAALDHTLASSWTPSMALGGRINELLRQRRAIEAQLATISRDIVARPLSERGALPVQGAIPAAIQAVVQEGRNIVESYIHPAILPKSSFVTEKKNRSFHSKGVSHLSSVATGSVAAHEIVHGIEFQFSHVLDKTRTFLAQRAAGKAPVKLKSLFPAINYKPIEITFEDEWTARGGHPYSGKLYSLTKSPQHAYATEILTMGIERLHANPALFAHTDPDYFKFVVNTLRFNL